MPRPGRAKLIIAVGLILAQVSVASANLIVIRSFGPSAKKFPPGSRFETDGVLDLQSGDNVVMLDRNGTRALRGP